MITDNTTIDLLKKYNVAVPRYTSYPTAPEWQEKISQEDYTSKIVSLRDQDEIALYVHIPFCEKLCWYCGCNTIIKKKKDHAETYLQYLIQEIEQISEILQKRVRVGQLHWGGGSPNFLTDKQTIALLDKLDECFDIDYDGEIAIEIDPRTTEVNQIELYRNLGFNRISMGIQSFSADVQKAINRIQPYELIEEMVDFCRYLDFKSINFDLIYGLPKQTAATFQETLEKTIQLQPDRIALYSFAWLPDKISHMKLIKEEDMPTTSEKFELFLMATRALTKDGYNSIAMDHFALEEDELSIAYQRGKLHRNFMGYTVQEPRDSLGFGMSAISYIDHCYLQNMKSLKSYYQSLDDNCAPLQNAKTLNQDDLVRQWVINKLMCTLSLKFGDFKSRFNVEFTEYFAWELAELKATIEEDFFFISDKMLCITQQGSLFIRNICSLFDTYYQKNKKGFSKAI